MSAEPAGEAWDLVVIGAGPKGIAIAAKAHALNELRPEGARPLSVLLLERTAIASGWSGQAGSTSGTEELGTRAEKDVGFPYASLVERGYGPVGIETFMTRYSWHSYLVSTGAFATWIDGGMPNPDHRGFADYLSWVAKQLGDGLHLTFSDVTSVRVDDDLWAVHSVNSIGEGKVHRARGVVVTGHGEPSALVVEPSVESAVFDSSSLRSDIENAVRARGRRVCLVGAGESAGSLAVLLRQRFGADLELTVISPGPIRSRGESFAENAVYSNPDRGRWHLLTRSDRIGFIRSTDRGVFSQAALAKLASLGVPRHVAGKVTNVQAGPNPGDVRVVVAQHGERAFLDFDLVVNCTTTSAVGRVERLLEPAALSRVLDHLRVAGGAVSWEGQFDPALALKHLRPRLHVPALAAFDHGPGFANLSSLGLLSDRILEPYWHDAALRPESVPPRVMERTAPC